MTRLCECGCLRPLVQRKDEKESKFKRRRWFEHACYVRSMTAELEPVICPCGVTLERKRYKNNRLQAARDYYSRTFCDECLAKPSKPPTPPKRAKSKTKTPKPPQKPAERVIAPPRALPNPVKGEVFTVSLPHPLPGEVRCEIHPSEKVGTFGCSACNVGKNWAKNQPKARPGSGPKIWTAQ